MSNLPMFQSPYQRQLEIEQERQYESDAFFRMNALTFEGKMQRLNKPESIDIFYQVKKRGKTETEIATIKANEISSYWSAISGKEYTIDIEKRFFIQAKDYQRYLDQCTLRYVGHLKDEFQDWIMTESIKRFQLLKEAREHHSWLAVVCALTAEEAIMMAKYNKWLDTSENNFLNSDMTLKIGDLIIRRSQVGEFARANNSTFKYLGIGADARRKLEKQIADDPKLTPDQKLLKYQQIEDMRSSMIKKNSGLIYSSQTKAFNRMENKLNERHKAWLEMQEQEQQYRLEETDNE